MIAKGFVSIKNVEDTAIITSRRFDERTGEEIASQEESMTREQVEYYISMCQQQLEDLLEIHKLFL